LTAYNIINDLSVACVYKRKHLFNLVCPWNGTLGDSVNHISECAFKDAPEYIKNIINKENRDGEEVNTFLEFNSSKSLAARLYQKNKSLMESVFNDNQLEGKRDSILSFLDV
jgi:hypothetical protein